MKRSKITPLLILSFFTMNVTNCRSTESDAKFGWEEDLKDPPSRSEEKKSEDPAAPEARSAGPAVKPATPPDKNFCADTTDGQCFTLLMRIPAKSLINDLGLGALSLAGLSKDMQTRMDEACYWAWKDYKQRFINDRIHPLRQKFVKAVTKMRCIYYLMSEEYVHEDLPLGDKETAISVRMVKFDFEGRNTSTSAHQLKLDVESTFTHTQFRSVHIYGGQDVGGTQSGWDELRGFGYEPTKVRERINRIIDWSLPIDQVVSVGDSFSSSFPPGSYEAQAASQFLGEAREAGKAALENKSPLPAAFAFAVMGMNILKKICGETRANCKVISDKTKKKEEFGVGMAEMAPSSEVYETFRIALIKSIQGILNKAFEVGERAQIETTFNLPPK